MLVAKHFHSADDKIENVSYIMRNNSKTERDNIILIN